MPFNNRLVREHMYNVFVYTNEVTFNFAFNENKTTIGKYFISFFKINFVHKS